MLFFNSDYDNVAFKDGLPHFDLRVAYIYELCIIQGDRK